MNLIPFPRPSEDDAHLNQTDYNARQPMHLRIALGDITAGVQQRAPGIRRCGDCDTPYIDDHCGLTYCRDCRINHIRSCRDCGTRFRNTVNGVQLCRSCIDQSSLF